MQTETTRPLTQNVKALIELSTTLEITIRDLMLSTRCQKSEDPDGCHFWTGSKTTKGYGQYPAPGGRLVYAHRASYEQANGPIPAGLIVRHTCDVPSCINSDHLLIGTRELNARDWALRSPKSARLSTQDIQDIKASYPKISQVALAKMYNVTQQHISAIILGKTRKSG